MKQTMTRVIQAILAEVGKESPSPEEALQALRRVVRTIPGAWATLKEAALTGRFHVPKGTPVGVIAALHRAVEATRQKLYPKAAVKDFRGREIEAPPGPLDEPPEAVTGAIGALADLYIEEIREELGLPSIYEGTQRNLVPEWVARILEEAGSSGFVPDLPSLKEARETLAPLAKTAEERLQASQAHETEALEGLDWESLPEETPIEELTDEEARRLQRIVDAFDYLYQRIEALEAGRVRGLMVVDAKTGVPVLR